MRNRRSKSSERRAWPRGGAWLLAAVVLCLGCQGDASEGESDSASSSSVTAGLLENPPAAPPQSVNVTELGHDYGTSQAPVYVVEFSDFGCGYCRKFHLETFPSLQEEYIESGKLGWKMIPFVSGLFSNSRAAATAAECAALQSQFPAMRHLLFEDQREWKPADDPRPHFRRYARELGLDAEAFDRCLDEDPRAQRIEQADRTADQLGVRATPTFFIDGYPVQGAIPLDLFREVMEDRLAEAEKPGS